MKIYIYVFFSSMERAVKIEFNAAYRTPALAYQRLEITETLFIFIFSSLTSIWRFYENSTVFDDFCVI